MEIINQPLNFDNPLGIPKNLSFKGLTIQTLYFIGYDFQFKIITCPDIYFKFFDIEQNFLAELYNYDKVSIEWIIDSSQLKIKEDLMLTLCCGEWDLRW